MVQMLGATSSKIFSGSSALAPVEHAPSTSSVSRVVGRGVVMGAPVLAGGLGWQQILQVVHRRLARRRLALLGYGLGRARREHRLRVVLAGRGSPRRRVLDLDLEVGDHLAREERYLRVGIGLALVHTDRAGGGVGRHRVAAIRGNIGIAAT